MIGIDDYCFEDKNMWRVRAWSRIASRVKKAGRAAADSLVLYLAGKQDLDRKLALRHGFKERNLIAVEIEVDQREELRGNGVISIRGDINRVLTNWRYKDKIDVVLLDYCCGLETKVVHLMTFLREACVDNAAVLVNMQRGRDKSTNELRAEVERESFVDQVILQRWPMGDRRHRGLYLIAAMMKMLADTHCTKEALKRRGRSKELFIPMMLQLLNPCFLSYKSNVVMDSVLFTASDPVMGLLGSAGDELVERQYEELEGDEFDRRYDAEHNNPKVVRAIAAAMAVRTRRRGD